MRRIGLALTLAAILAVPANATTIVVNTGAYDSAAGAATDEANVTWYDADPSDEIICTECFAATELQRYLGRMVAEPTRFPIADDGADPGGDVILVGGPETNALSAKLAGRLGLQTGCDTLGHDDYVIKSARVDGRQVVLVAGGSRIGTLYATYDLLHRLGARWFAPGEINEEIPARDLGELPGFDVMTSPSFSLRGFHAWEDRGDDEFILWMARNRINYWCVEQSNKPLLHKVGIQLVGGGHVLTDHYLSPHVAYGYNHPRFTGDEDKPADPYKLSAQYMGDANSDGKLTNFEAHPDWYALRDGKRSNSIHGDGGDNFCTSNEDAMTEWMKRAVDDLVDGRYKDAQIMNAWMLDGGKWCQCEACEKLGTRTDRNLLVIHHYASAIKRAQADGRINRPIRLLFLAYADVLEPPSRPLPEGFDYDMCIATYFPISRCYVHEFEDAACGRNARYKKHLLGWAVDPDRHYKGQLCIGEYYNVSGYKCLPICFKRTMATDIPYYHSLGARLFHYMHCTTQQWGNKALTNWQMARQLWDEDVDCGQVWNDYFAGRYQRAYPQMREFYETLEWVFAAVTDLKYGLSRRLENQATNHFPSSHLKYALTDPPIDFTTPPGIAYYEKDAGPSLLDSLKAAEKCRAILNQVLAMDLPERVRARVLEDERLFTYGERTLKFYDAIQRTDDAIAAEDMKAAWSAFDEVEELQRILKADTTSPKFSSSHASASNAFAASYATGAPGRLRMQLGPGDPEKLPLLEAVGGATLYTDEFMGGGGPIFGYGLHSFPGRIFVSERGNYIYSKGNGPASSMVGWFRSAEGLQGSVTLTLHGLLCPEGSKGTIEGQVLVNDQEVYRGDMKFDERKLTELQATFATGLLAPGVNKIEIRNEEPGGRVGGRPWFGVERVELQFVVGF